MKKVILSICSVVLMLFFFAPAVHADPITATYYFTSDHMTDGAGTPPFGEVVLTENASGGVVFLVSLYDDSGFIRTGAGDGMNFKFNATDVALAEITPTTSGLAAAYAPTYQTGTKPNGTPIYAGVFDGDGGGDFYYGVYFPSQASGGGAAIPGPIQFTVANATIADFTSPAQVALNGKGQIFVADIISGQTGYTGLVDVSAAPVPIPAAAWLLGSGLLGLVAVRRRFTKK